MRDITDSLIEDYAKSNAINDIDVFLNTVATIIKENNGEIDYDYFKKIFDGKSLDYNNFVNWAFFAFAITKHIPKYINNIKIIRSASECFHDTITFLYTRIEEDFMLKYSQDNEDGLPPLRRRDPADNNKFHPGTGKRIADFETIKEPHIGYEMKASGGSPSGYHDSSFIIIPSKSDEYKYVVYRLSNPGNAILPATKYVLKGFYKLDRQYNEFNRLTAADAAQFSEENLAILDQKLANLGYSWPR